MALFKKKTKVTEEKLADALFELAWARTKSFNENNPISEMKDNNNLYFIELMILNMFLVIAFSSEKVTYIVFDLMTKRFWQILVMDIGYSHEHIEELKNHQHQMYEWYQGIVDKNINDNYLEQLSVHFLSHITQKEYSGYTAEALSLAQEIAENIKLITDITHNIKPK